MANAMKQSPNCGFVRAIYGLNAVLGVLLSHIILKTPLNWKILGSTALVTMSTMIFIYNV